jgi:endonuclease/exonuclease/phosphatase (EEP) superfamily protein YafD
VRPSRLIVLLLLVLLLVPAGALTVARFVEPDGARWVRLVSFTPFAIPLYAVAVLLLLVLAWKARGPARGLSRVLLAGSVVALGLHAYVASGPYVGGPAAAAQSGTSVRVMTANLGHGEADPARLMGVAVANDVDLLVLQEITPAALAALASAGLDEAFPFHAGEPGEGTMGTMVFSTAEVTGASRLDTTYGGWSVHTSLADHEVQVLAVHPHAPVGDAVLWRQDHQAVLRAAAELGPKALVVGDFNATMDHRPMRELAGRGFTDAATEANAGWQPTWPSGGEVDVLGFGVPSLLPIDHVLVGADIRATRTESVTIPGTDHRALVATLVL